MKTFRKLLAMFLVLAMLVSDSGVVALADAVLTMPAALQIIEEEAFYGSTSIDKVVLSNNVKEIRARAFANSTLSEINLPDSLTFIAEDAFDGPNKVKITANAGTYAYSWAVNNGYISLQPTEAPHAPVLNRPAATGNVIALSWSKCSGAQNYKIYYGTSSVFSNATELDVGNVTEFAITGLKYSTTYYVWVKAENEAGLSDTNGYMSIKTKTDKPIISSIAASGNTISVEWNMIVGAESYIVYYSTNSWMTDSTELNVDTPNIIIENLNFNKKYYIEVAIVANGKVGTKSDYIMQRTETETANPTNTPVPTNNPAPTVAPTPTITPVSQPYDPTGTIKIGSIDTGTDVKIYSDGGGIRVYAKAKGTMTISSNNDWIMVYKSWLDEEKLLKNHTTVADYQEYVLEQISQFYMCFYVSALQNTTGHTRYGSITITCGTASVDIPVSQPADIVAASLTHPVLSQTKDSFTNIPYDRISLRWTEGMYGSGDYYIELREKKENAEDYNTVLVSRQRDSLYYNISTKYLSENSDYILYLYTVANEGKDAYEKYYFHVGSIEEELIEDQLSLSANEWEIFENAGSSLILSILTDDDWTITSHPNWISVSDYSGHGNSTVFLYAEDNSDAITRSGSLIVETFNESQILQIEQVYNESDIWFSMSSNEITVGDEVRFDVYAKNAEKVRLLVDGKEYEEYTLEDHMLTFRRKFTSGGKRLVAFQQYSDNSWNSVSFEQSLLVAFSGSLDSPIIEQPEQGYAGENIQITWGRVENASEYIVRVYYYTNDTSILLSTENTTLTTLKLSSDILQTAGHYIVHVMAISEGYNQSESSIEFQVINREYTASIDTPLNGNEFVPGDTLYISASQTGGGYMVIVVRDDNGNEWCYPADGESLYTDASVLVEHTVEDVSAYNITAYVFSTNKRAAFSQAANTSNTVAVTVNGPIIFYAYNEAKNYTWVTPASSKHMVVHTNNNVGHISILDNNDMLVHDHTDYEENENFYRDFTIPLDTGLTKGRHDIIVYAYNQDKTDSTVYSYCVYVVETVTNGDTVYPKNETATLYSSPYKGSVKGTVSGGEYYDCLKIIGDTDDWYRVSISNQNAFIKKSEVSPSIPANAANGIKIISPENKSQFSISENVTFKWKAATSQTGTELLNGFISFRKVDTPDVSYKSYSVPSGTTELTVPMSDFEEGTYIYSIGVYTRYYDGSFTSNETLLSDEYQLTVGSITLEDSYRNWWMNNVAGIITQYNNGIVHLNNSHLSGRYKNQITVSGYAPTGLYSCYLLSAYELSQDQLRMNWSWTQDDNNYQKIRSMMPEEMERLTRIAIISAMQQDEESNHLSAPLSTMKNVSLNEDNLLANAKRMVMQRETTVDVATEAIDEIYQAVIITMKAGELCSGKIGDTDAETVIQEILELFWDALKAYLQDSVSEADAKVVLKAYVNQYKMALQQAADIYIDYLEEAYFGANSADFDSVQKQVARSVIDDFKAFKNDDSRLEQIAIDAFINSQSKYQWSDIENESDEFWAFLREGMTPQACYDLMIDTLKGVLKDWLEDYLGANATTAKYVDKVADMVDALIKVDVSPTGKLNTSLDVDAFLEKIAETAGRDVGRDFLTTVFQNKISDGSWTTAIKVKMRDGLNLKWVHHDITESYKKQTGAFTKMCKACWKFGKGLPKLVFDIEQLIEACQGRGEYDTYSNLMQSGIQNSLSIWINSGLSPFKQQSQFNYLTVKELEHLRQSMIALVKSDEYIIKMYDRMKAIDQNAGCSFTKAYTSFSWALKDDAFTIFERSKKQMMSIPSSYLEIVNSAETGY